MRTLGDLLSTANNGINHVVTLGRSTPFAQDYKRVYKRTMCSHARLKSLYDGVLEVTGRSVAGDIVECGTARGGSAALMGLALKRRGYSNRLWIFDTFEGMPAPTTEDPLSARAYTGGFVPALAFGTYYLLRSGVNLTQLRREVSDAAQGQERRRAS